MEIKDILSKLGLDLSNPEARRGALEAIDAILTSRANIDASDLGGGSGGSNGGEQEVELDPDLLQPSIKQNPSVSDDEDIEIEDEENILDQIKHKESEDPIENTNSNGNDSKSNKKSDNLEDDKNDYDSKEKPDDESSQPEPDENKSGDNSKVADDDLKNSTEYEESDVDTSNVDDSETDFDDNSGNSIDVDEEEFDDNIEDSEGSSEDFDDDFGDSEKSGLDGFDDDSEFDGVEIDDDDVDYDDDEDDEDDEFEFDEDDFIDDDLKNSAEDEEIKTKHDARKIKRERTLAAAKKALLDAQAKRVSPALIRELEKSIEALEALTEAVAKSIKDISDEEFNLMINRVLDAIDACGDSGLTYTSKEEREAKVKEIKADLAKAETQNELSAEDVAKIRAETQAIKAREKETSKYARRANNSFKGFQEFLSSLYKAIALQVHNEETKDDTWSALSRRNSGVGVLRQGQRINDLPNKRIPIIDFYFDTSTSWGSSDIKVGMKAVSQLADMQEKGQIKLNIFYFSDDVSETPTRGGTSGWNEIVKNVIATQATNVVVMTDSDMQGWWNPQNKPPLRYTVPGYVWYLWKDGVNAPRLPQDLNGRGGTQQFSFNIGDV